MTDVDGCVDCGVLDVPKYLDGNAGGRAWPVGESPFALVV
jgi:hypothetical protein